MSTFRNLLAWQKAMDLVDAVYVAVRDFPKYELFGLSQQLRTSVVSIPSLIAEGRGRHTRRDYLHFLYEARGSSHEVETQLEIAVRQEFISAQEGEKLVAMSQEVGKLISSLIRALLGPGT